MFAIPARRGAMTRVERRKAVVTILSDLFVLLVCVSRVGRLSTFASLFTTRYNRSSRLRPFEEGIRRSNLGNGLMM